MSPEEHFWWGWAASAATAAGTILLALVALWGDQIRRRFFPPRLRLNLLSKEGEKAQAGEDRRPARFHHLRVTNLRRRWSVATRVQVYLLRVETPAADGQFQVVWNTPVPIRWRFQEVSPIARDIGPPADCDLCSVTKGRGLDLHPLIKPLFLKAEYPERARLRLTFEAQSVEADSEPVRVEVAWDGNWADGDREMTRHLVVTEVARYS